MGMGQNLPFWGRCTNHSRSYFSGDWDVHWGYGLLTHGQMGMGHLFMPPGYGSQDSWSVFSIHNSILDTYF